MSAACAPAWAGLGAKTIPDFQKRAKFVRISNAGIRESHAHGVLITRESPNYPGVGGLGADAEMTGILYPVFVQVGLTFTLLFLMGFERFKAVKAGTVQKRR